MSGVATMSVCPSAVVEAPVERVWELARRPERWADVTLAAAEPPGPAVPGQDLRLTTRALGRTFAVRILVRDVDEERRRLRYLVELPFGVVNDEVVTLAEAGDGRTLVRLG
jgi:Polyketide cyclase / dehydrase and lipid transport